MAGGFPKQHTTQELLAVLPGSRSQTKGPCDTCRTHRLLLTFPDSSVPAPCHTGWSCRSIYLFIFKKSSTQHSTHSGSGFRRKEDWQGGHEFSHGMRNMASIRHPCWAKTPPVCQRSVPSPSAARASARCQGKAHCSPGPREAPGFPAGAILIGRGRSGHASTASPCRELHVSPRCRRAPLSLNPARKRDALFPQG